MQLRERKKHILDLLHQTEEQLFAWGEDLWHSVDHRCNDAVQEAAARQAAFNELVMQFGTLTSRLDTLIETQYTATEEAETETKPDTDAESKDAAENERVIAELDRARAWTLDETSFTWKRPWAARLGRDAQRELNTWQSIYHWALHRFAERAPDRFRSLPDSDLAHSKRRCYIHRNSEKLYKPLVVSGVAFECNFSANDITERIRQIADYCQISDTFYVYLREDRDA